MSQRLQILFIQQPAASADPAVEALRQSGQEVTLGSAADAAGLAAALASGSWDCVVAGGLGTAFNTLEALAVVRREAGSLPFIAYSEPAGEEAAAALIKAGADDLVLRGRPERLAAAVSASVEIRGRRAGQTEPEALAAVLDDGPNPIFTALPDGSLNYANKAARQLLAEVGRLPEDWAGPLQQAWQTGEARRGECQAGGRWFDCVFRRPAGAAHISIYCREITEFKQAAAALQESETMYRLLAENSSDGVALIDGEGKAVYVSPAYQAMAGRSRTDLLGAGREKILDYVHPDDRPAIAAEVVRGREQRLPTSRYEYRTRTDSGDFVWVEDVLRREFDTQGNVTRVIINGRNIQDRKQAEASLRSQNQYLSTLHQILLDLLDRRDLDSLLQTTAHRAAELLDASHSTIILAEGDTLVDRAAWPPEHFAGMLLPPGHPSPVRRVYDDRQPLFSDGYSERSDVTQTTAALGLKSVMLLPILTGGKCLGILGFGRSAMGSPFTEEQRDLAARFVEVTALIIDNAQLHNDARRELTERRAAEAALRASQERFQALIEHSWEALTLVDADNKVIYYAASNQRITGYTADDRLGQFGPMHVHPDDSDRVLAEREQTKREPGAIHVGEYRVRHKNGHWIWVETVTHNLLDEPSVQALALHSRDVTARKHGQEIARRQAESQKMLYDLLRDVSLKLSVDDIARAAVDHLTGLKRWPSVLISRLDPGGATWTVLAWRAWQPGWTADQAIWTQPIERGIAGRAYRTGQTQRVADVSQDADYLHGGGPNTFSELAVPIPPGPGARFVLNLESDQPDAFDDAEVQLVESLAGALSLAFENARLFDTVQAELAERRRVEEILRDTSQKLQAVIGAAPVAVATYTPEGLVQSWNPAAEKLFGWKEAEVLGKFPPQVSPDKQDEFAALNARMGAGEVVTGVEIERRRKDGSPIHIRLNTAPFYDAAGQYTGYIGILEDITTRRQAEEALRESEEKFRLISEQALMGIGIIQDDRIVYANQALSNINGYPLETLLTWDLTDIAQIIHPDDRIFAIEQARKKQAGAAEAVTHYQYRSITPEGQIRWVDQYSKTVHYRGRPADLVTLVDVTAAHEAGESLRRSEQIYRQAIEASGLVPYYQSYVGPDRSRAVFTFIGDGIERMTGYKPAEFSSELFDTLVLEKGLVGEAARFAWNDAIRRARSGDLEVWTCDYRIRARDGQIRWLFDAAVEVRDERGETTGSIGIFQDVTERMQAVEAMQRLNAELERRVAERTADLMRANRAKDDFLAAMSHELRTPLTGILGLSEALQMEVYGALTERQTRALRTIESSGQHLLALINDILDLSKIEAGKLELQVELCSLAEICQSSLQLTTGLARQKGQEVTFSMNPATLTLQADPRRLKQMLVNLLSNAVKFTPEGGRLGLEALGNAAEGKVSLIVWDQGIGIEPAALSRLFQPFVQLDSSLARAHTGTGLGLSLVRRLAELHHGQVEVQSTPGEGSRFIITLPWTRPAGPGGSTASARPATGPLAQTPALTASAGQRRPLVVIVDDNKIAQEAVSDYLTAQGFEVINMYTGLELLERVAAIQPDVILMDIQMPGLDGLQTTRQLRQHADRRAAAVPVIAMTALAMAGDRERCLAAGADEYLSKPVALPDLAAAIRRRLPRDN